MGQSPSPETPEGGQVPALRHEDVRDELFGGLSDAGVRHYEAFAAIYEARQIASGLAELRTAAGLSQREAAKRAGVDQADLSRIESGQIIPSLPTLLRLLDVAGSTLVLARNPAPREPAAKKEGVTDTAVKAAASTSTRKQAGTAGKSSA
jgi:transcriptional regulator with XRE-family HTH domain